MIQLIGGEGIYYAINTTTRHSPLIGLAGYIALSDQLELLAGERSHPVDCKQFLI